MDFDLTQLEQVKDPVKMLKELYTRIKGYSKDVSSRLGENFSTEGAASVYLADNIIKWIETEAKNF